MVLQRSSSQLLRILLVGLICMSTLKKCGSIEMHFGPGTLSYTMLTQTLSSDSYPRSSCPSAQSIVTQNSGVKISFTRTEFQLRDTPHWHMLLWIDTPWDVTKLSRSSLLSLVSLSTLTNSLRRILDFFKVPGFSITRTIRRSVGPEDDAEGCVNMVFQDSRCQGKLSLVKTV